MPLYYKLLYVTSHFVVWFTFRQGFEQSVVEMLQTEVTCEVGFNNILYLKTFSFICKDETGIKSIRLDTKLANESQVQTCQLQMCHHS